MKKRWGLYNHIEKGEDDVRIGKEMGGGGQRTFDRTKKKENEQ